MIKKVAISEIGISINGRMAISQFRKKKKITSTTSAKAMINVSSTSLNDCRIFLVLSIKTLNSISDLFDFLISSRRLLNSSAISILLAPGCGMMARPTAFTPLYFQLCSSTSGPNFYLGHITQPNNTCTVFPNDQISKLLFRSKSSQSANGQFRIVAINFSRWQFNIFTVQGSAEYLKMQHHTHSFYPDQARCAWHIFSVQKYLRNLPR